jgi:selenocysteine-specific elongation factor
VLESEGRVKRLGSDLDYAISTGGWQRITSIASGTLKQFHILYPLRQGMPLQDFRGQLKLKTAPFSAVLHSMIAEDLVTTNGASIGIPSHEPSLSTAAGAEAKEYLSLISTDRYSPSTERPIDIELLQFLSERGDVVRIGGDIVYPADAYAEMETKILDAGADGSEITITGVRAIFGTSRKYTLAVLEHMDSKGLTRRTGDSRFAK